MDTNPRRIRQPSHLTDEQWIALLRVNAQSWIQYVFGSFHLFWANAAFLLVHVVYTHQERFQAYAKAAEHDVDAQPDRQLDLHHWPYVWIGYVLLTALVVVLRDRSWRRQRAAARAAGL